MLRFIKSKDAKYNGLTYRGRTIIADEKLLDKLVKVPEAIVYSSWRSLEEQKVLFSQGKSKTLMSNHRRGLAVDVINWKEVESKMNKLGLINDISWDKNHFTLGGESVAAKEVVYDTLPKNLKEYLYLPIKEVKTPQIEAQNITATATPVVQAISGDVIEIPKDEFDIYTEKSVEPMQEQSAPTQKLPITDMFIELWKLIINFIKK